MPSFFSKDKVEAEKPKVVTEDLHETDSNAVDTNLVALAAQYVPGSAAEKAFLKKIDRRIVPCIWALYTLSYLDRANIG